MLTPGRTVIYTPVLAQHLSLPAKHTKAARMGHFFYKRMNTFTQLKQVPPPSSAAIEAFRLCLPKLLVFVNEKFAIDNRFVFEGSHSPKINLIQDFNKNFGELLLAVYEFNLYENLVEELLLHITALDSRELKKSFFDMGLNSWIMGIQCTIKHPECDELVHPLQWLHRNLALLYEKVAEVESGFDERSRNFMDLLLKRNRKFAAEHILSLMREGTSIEQIYSSVLLPVLRHIRLLWRQKKISIAEEHAATDICRYIILRVIDSIFNERRLPFEVLVACVPGEAHVLDGEVFANFLETKGWPVFFIGRDIPEEDIIHALQTNRPRVVVLSVASIARLPGARSLIGQIRGLDPNIKIVLEGHAALLARQPLAPITDAVVSGLEDGHATLFNLVMPHA